MIKSSYSSLQHHFEIFMDSFNVVMESHAAYTISTMNRLSTFYD